MTPDKANVEKGQLSPYIADRRTINATLEVVRRFGGSRGTSGSGPISTEPIQPAVQVYVRNDTGDDLDWGAILKLSDTIVDITVDEDVPEAVARPVFAGTAPSTSVDPFVVLKEPIADGQIGRGTIMGVAVCDISVVVESHGFAFPGVDGVDRLRSGFTGPAKILWKESGTGTKRARVLLCGQTSPASSGVAHGYSELGGGSHFSLVPENNWLNVIDVTLPGSGVYHLFGRASGSGIVTANVGPGGCDHIAVKLVDEAASADVPNTQAIVVGCPPDSQMHCGSASINCIYEVSSSRTIGLYAIATTFFGSTWSAAPAIRHGALGPPAGAGIGYVRLQ